MTSGPYLLPIRVLKFEDLFYYLMIHLKYCWMSGEQCRPSPDGAFCEILLCMLEKHLYYCVFLDR